MNNKIILGAFFLLSFFFILSGLKQIGEVTVLPKMANTTVEDDIDIEPLTLDKIFSNDKSYISSYLSDRIRTINVTGDVLPARTVNTRTLLYNDFQWSWINVSDRLKDADLTYINLETPLISNCPPTDVGMIFCGDVRHTEGLLSAGVDIANLANNHTGNHGQVGIEETVLILESNGIDVVGIPGKIPIKDIRGVRFAFLGYTDIEPVPGVNRADEDLIKSEITRARQLADVVIVQMHWGAEYQAQPDERQKYLARFIIDSGADLIIGNHPHWIQPVEIYKGKLITYAHGNFIFDQEWSQKTKEGVMGTYYFYDDQLIDVEFHPVIIQDFGQAHWIVDGAHYQTILNYMRIQSEMLKSASTN